MDHHHWDLRIAVKDVRQRMKTNYEVNKDFGIFNGLETLIFSGVASYFGLTLFSWNVYLTFILSVVVMMVISFSSFYKVLAFVFSVGWAYIGYKFLFTMITFLGGNDSFASIIGIVGFLLAFYMSTTIRNGDKPVFS